MSYLDELEKLKDSEAITEAEYWLKKIAAAKEGTKASSVTKAENKSAADKIMAQGYASLSDDELAALEAQKAAANATWFKKSSAFDDGYQVGDVIKTVMSSDKDLATNVAAGLLGIGEKVVDAGAMAVGWVGGKLGNEEFKQNMGKFVAEDLYDEKKLAQDLGLGTSLLDKILVATGVKENDWEKTEAESVFGDKSDSLAQSFGQLLGNVALKGVGVPWFLTTGVTSFASASEGALRNGASFDEAAINGLISAGAEMLSEKMFGGSGLGEKGFINVELFTKNVSNKVIKALLDFGIDVTGEGIEEVVSEFVSTLGEQLTYEREQTLEELLSDEAAMDNYIHQVGEALFGKEARENYKDAFIGGAALGGIMNAGKVTNTIKEKTDYRTGLTDAEEAVVSKAVEKQISEKEANGEKVDKKVKAEIRDKTLKDLEKGYISTDAIEEALGEDGRKAIEDLTKESEEFNKLYNTPDSELSKAQRDKLARLEAKNAEKSYEDQIKEAKQKLSEDTQSLLKSERNGKGSKLTESYNEAERRKQKFTVDLSKVDKKYKDTIQRAIDSGVMNNTNRSHEFVDMIAKLESDKGVKFDFTNNERLKESGFALDGKTINGMTTKDGVTVNVNSQKALDTVVGHEITHVLEGSELYGELQKAIFDYAKTKGEYQSRYDALTKLYEGIEDADIDAELTADLVGDYLFSDADFVKNLHAKNRNVFQKIYDEIKYLCKVATAGSKEARELERVKKLFDEVYKTEAKVSEETRYSVSEDDASSYGNVRGEDVAFDAPAAEEVAPVEAVEEIAPEAEGVEEVAPEMEKKVTATKIVPETTAPNGVIPDGTRVRAKDRGNIGVVKSYNEATGKYSVYFKNKSGLYATVTLDADVIEPLKTSKNKNVSEDIEDIETEEPKVAEVLESAPKEAKKVNLASKIKSLVFDKQSSIEDLSLKTKNRELMAKADFMLRSESRAQRHIKNKLMPLLEKVEATGKKNDIETYAYHLHNIDRMSIEENAKLTIEALKGKFASLKPEQVKAIAARKITPKTTEKTSNTIKEAKEYLNALEAKNKPVFGDTVTSDVSREFVKEFEAKNPKAKEIADALVEYNNELREMLVEGGVISRKTADAWSKMYPHYVPIKRAGKSGNAVTVPLDTGRTGVDAPIRRAKGGNSDVESLLDTMASRTQQVYRAVARNSFGIELMKTLGTVVDSSPASVDEIYDTFDNTQDELLKKGENGANPSFTVFKDGERVEFDITEELYDALKPTNDFLKTEIPGLTHLAKFQRGILTQYNPTFIVTNAIKDIQDVIINSQHPAKTYKNVPEAVKELWNATRGKEGKWITEYLDNGGDDLTVFDSKKQVFVEDDSTVKKVVGFVPNKIAEANDFVEKIPRLAEFIASRKNGASVEAAMLDAARVTTNFAAGGDLTKFINKNGFTFLNASVQGFNQQVRNIREAKVDGLKGAMQLAAKYSVAGLPIMLLNALLWDDDEDYKELSDYVKDNYYVVAKYGDGKFVRIPKGRAAAVIQNAFEQMKNFITGDDEVDMERFGQLVVENIAPNNPMDNNVIAPIIQAATNKTWYGGELVPQRLQDVPEAEQYDETTDAISKWLGEKLNISPYKINYILDQYSGGVGDILLPLSTPEVDGGGLLAPMLDKFTTDSTLKNQNVTDFYDASDELTKNANSLYATDDDILKSKYMNSVNSEIGELYKQKRETQNSDLPDDEKLEAVREIQAQINELAKNALSNYENIHYEGDGNYAVIGGKYFEWYTPNTGDPYWRKLDDEQTVKYNLTKNAGNAHYVTDGNVHYRLDDDGKWTKISDKDLARQKEVTQALGITPEEYWKSTDTSFVPLKNGEYEYAYENPGKYAVSKAVGGYDSYRTYVTDLYNIKADKDANGKTIAGSRKEKVVEYINGLDIDAGAKMILYKSEFKSDKTYDRQIVAYLNSREDLDYNDMKTILEELGAKVDSKGKITWD